MDLTTVEELVTAPGPADWRPGDAWLAGGTWLFSEPQDHLRRLLDLTSLGWEPLAVTADGLEIAATCTVAELHAFTPPADWRSGPLVRRCCEAFLASFKVWNLATVGGNLCNALPAGPLISLAAALDGDCRLIGPDGERHVPALDFVTGDGTTVLAPGELLRSITLPAPNLLLPNAFRRMSLTELGRSAALLIGQRRGAAFQVTVTAATRHPVRLAFPAFPTAAELAAAIATKIPDALWFDDVHGLPAWRAHLTRTLAEEIRQELS